MDESGPEDNPPEGAAGEPQAVQANPPGGAEERILELEGRLRAVSAAYRQKEEEMGQARERLQRHFAMAEEIRRGEVVMSLFEPVENLHRSLKAVEGHSAEGGLRMVYQQFMSALQKLGLEEVPGVGSAFDPAVHEAIATQPVAAREEDGVIQAVFAAGYRIGTRLVRPARVIVGAYDEPAGEA